MSMFQSFAILPIIYGVRQIEWDEERIHYVRIAFAVVQVAILSCIFYIKTLVDGKPNPKKITVPTTPLEQAKAGENPPMEKTVTLQEYDQGEMQTLLTQTLLPLAIISVIHYKWETVIPLCTQLIMAPMKLYNHGLFRSYVRGESVSRPFPQPKLPFADLKEQLEGKSQPPAKKKNKGNGKKKN